MRALWRCVMCAGMCVPVGSMAIPAGGGARGVQGWVVPAALTTVSVPEPTPAPRGPLLQVVADAQLDDMRGGFEAPTGLRVAFGIERSVLVNGQLVATTSLNVMNTDSGFAVNSFRGDMMLGGGALRIFSGGQGEGNTMNVAMIQVGPGNGAGVSVGNLVGTVIQNTLDAQRIQNVTTVNAAANSVQLSKNNALFSNLRDAMIGGFRH